MAAPMRWLLTRSTNTSKLRQVLNPLLKTPYIRNKEHLRLYASRSKHAFGSNERVWWSKLGIGCGSGTILAFFGPFKKKDEAALTPKDIIKDLVIKGMRAKSEGRTGEADDIFHEALRKSAAYVEEDQLTEKDDLNHKVFIFDQLANLNLDVGNLESAENLFKETMRIALHLGMEKNHNAIINMSMKLALIYLYGGKTDLGLQGIEHCIKECEGKLKIMDENAAERKNEPVDEELESKLRVDWEDTSILLGKAHRHHAKYFMDKGQLQKAVEKMLLSLEIAKNVMGPEHDQVFVIMNDLGAIHISLKEYSKAEAVFKEGIRLSHKVNSPVESALLTNLGFMYIEQGKFDAANQVCQKSYKLAESVGDAYLLAPAKICVTELEELKNIREEVGDKTEEPADKK